MADLSCRRVLPWALSPVSLHHPPQDSSFQKLAPLSTVLSPELLCSCGRLEGTVLVGTGPESGREGGEAMKRLLLLPIQMVLYTESP